MRFTSSTWARNLSMCSIGMLNRYGVGALAPMMFFLSSTPFPTSAAKASPVR